MWTTWDKTVPQTPEDTAFLACGAPDLGCGYVLPTSPLGQGLLRAWLGWSLRRATQNGAVRAGVLACARHHRGSARMCVALLRERVCVRGITARRSWGRELNLRSQRHLWQVGFAQPLLAQNGLRGTIMSFSANSRVFCAHRVSPNRDSQTLDRIYF